MNAVVTATVPPRDVVPIACGDWHSVAVRADGGIVVVGNNQRHQGNVGGWSSMRAVAAGYLHTVGLGDDDKVVAAGENSTGVRDAQSR